jgi:pyridoxine 4-dehydrogenase
MPGNNFTDEQVFATLKEALANGINCWNAGEFYGTPERNSLTILESYFARYPEDADKVVLSVKGGNVPGTWNWDSSAANVRRSVKDCAGWLQGRKKIDIYEIARHDGVTPWEETLGALEELVKEGLIGGIALSEVGVKSIETAAKLAKIAAVEVELSLSCPEVLENGVAEACGKHGIPILA